MSNQKTNLPPEVEQELESFITGLLPVCIASLRSMHNMLGEHYPELAPSSSVKALKVRLESLDLWAYDAPATMEARLKLVDDINSTAASLDNQTLQTVINVMNKLAPMEAVR